MASAMNTCAATDVQTPSCDDSTVASGPVVFGYEDPTRNLLKNWSFESPITDDDWKLFRADAKRSKDSHTGDWSLHVHTREHKHGQAYQRVADVKPGVCYYYSCFIKFLTHPEPRNFFKSRLFVSVKLVGVDRTQRINIGRLNFQRAPTPWQQFGGDFILPNEPIEWIECRLELNDHLIDFLLDSASLIELPADRHWKRTLDKEIEKHRTSKVNLSLKFPRRLNPEEFTIKIRQKKLDFGFGGGISADVFNSDNEVSRNHRDCFYRHFQWAVFINDTKWKPMEHRKGQIKFKRVDQALETLHEKGITVRAHAIHWNRKESCPGWVQELKGDELQQELDRRSQYVVEHFKGKFVQWDVCNEHLHNRFFEEMTDNHEQIHRICRIAHEVDPECDLYINDYQLVRTGDFTSAQANLARNLLADGVPIHGVGIQSHLRELPIPVEILKKRLEIVCSAGLPVMITEFSVHTPDVRQRARSLEEALYVYFSNPNVAGVTFWMFGDQQGMTMGDDMPLFEGTEFKPNKAGKKFRSLLRKWRTKMDIRTSSHRSRRTFRAFHGQYELEVFRGKTHVWSRSFKVINGQTLDLDVDIDLEDSGSCEPETRSFEQVESLEEQPSSDDDDDDADDDDDDENSGDERCCPVMQRM